MYFVCVMFVQRFEPRGRRSTNFHYYCYYYYYQECGWVSVRPWRWPASCANNFMLPFHETLCFVCLFVFVHSISVWQGWQGGETGDCVYLLKFDPNVFFLQFVLRCPFFSSSWGDLSLVRPEVTLCGLRDVNIQELVNSKLSYGCNNHTMGNIMHTTLLMKLARI